MNKTGVALKIEKRNVIVMTNTGEFVKVKLSSTIPKIGERYTGVIVREKSNFKHYIAAAVLFFMFLTGGGAYAYYTPVSTIDMSINPSIELKINLFDRIISCSSLNNDGETILQHLRLKNRNIDEALTLVIDQAKKDNFINANYIAQGKTIFVKISSKNVSKSVNLDKFEECIAQNKINTQINDNGKEKKQEFVNSEKPFDGQNINKDNNRENNQSKEQIKTEDKSNNNSQEKQNNKAKLNNVDNNNELKNKGKNDGSKIENHTENQGEVKSNTSKSK